jgi:SNF2 family DNA or RNA helicase
MFAALLEKFSGDNMIICDEATMIKSIEAKRTQALIALCDEIKYSMFLSGTFIPQDLQDVFTIYRAMDGGATFGENIYVARSKYMQNVGDIYPKWELSPDKREEFISKLYNRGIRLRKEDCLDLPPKVEEIRKCYLTSQQAVYYNKMRKELSVELDDVSISAANMLSRLSKLQQIVGGFIYDSAGHSHFIPSAKYGLLTEILEQIGDDKVVIYARYRQELEKIQAHLAFLGYGSTLLHGGLNEKTRAWNIHEFRTNPKMKALVAQISTGGYGLTIVEANHIIYFSMTFSLIDFKQSQDRIHRIGQTKTCIYHYLLTEDEIKTPIDQYIFNSLKKNNDLANSLANFEEYKKLKEEVL